MATVLHSSCLALATLPMAVFSEDKIQEATRPPE